MQCLEFWCGLGRRCGCRGGGGHGRSRRHRLASGRPAVPAAEAFAGDSGQLGAVLQLIGQLALGLLEAKRVARLERAALEGGLEQVVEALDVRRDQIVHVLHVAGGVGLLAPDALAEEDALHHVELFVVPRLEEGGQVVAQEPVVHEGLVALVGEVGRDGLLEEVGVLLVEEEAELVAGILAVQLALLVDLELGPLEEEAELHERGVAAEGGVKAVDAGQGVVGLELAGGDVVENELLALGHHLDLLLLGEVLVGLEAGGEAQVVRGHVLLGQGHLAVGGVEGIDGHDVESGVGAQVGAFEGHGAVLVGPQVGEHDGGLAKEVEIGEALLGAARGHALLGAPRSSAEAGGAHAAVLAAAAGDLRARLGGADGPRVEQQARALEQVAGELLGILALEDVAVLLADVAAGDVVRLHLGHGDQIGLGERRREAGIERVLGQVAVGRHVDAGELRGVLQRDGHRVVARGDGGDLEGLGVAALEVAALGEHVAQAVGALGEADGDAGAAVLEQQVVVAGWQVAHLHEAALDGEGGEAILHIRAAALLEQR